MLFDYRKQTDVVSLDGIVSWLETKNPEGKYRFMDCSGGCLFSQYLQERFHLPKMHSSELKEHFNAWELLHAKYWGIASGGAPKSGQFRVQSTFGEALERAREAQAKADIE